MADLVPERSLTEMAPDASKLFDLQEHLLHEVSQAADAAAQQNLFGRSANTIRMYKAAFAAMRLFLAGIDERLNVALDQEPRYWKAMSFGLVEAFQLWLLDNGYAIKTVNDYLGVIKTYAALAQQARLMTAETLLSIHTTAALVGR